MESYIHKVHYYETDKMGITHHSNYVRWMEEARAALLNQIGYGLKRLEKENITSPVLSVECQYKNTTTFDDKIKIDVSIEQYSGARLTLAYIMTNAATEKIVFTAKSSHCFIDAEGRPIAVKKYFPEFNAILKSLSKNK